MQLTRGDAAHLLRRTGFGVRLADVEAYEGLDRVEAVDRVLAAADHPEPAPDPGFLDGDALRDWEKHVRLQWWWLDRMATTSAPLVEKLTLFWHGHLTSAQDKLHDIELLHRQNQLYRGLALGSYRDLTQAMCIEPAMLLYLDNASNVAGEAQENFAREVQELFTLGIGNYGEADVIAMARAWTGHGLTADGRSYRFHPDRHDGGQKVLYGIRRNWDGPAAIDEILLGSKREVAARFIVGKLWSFLVAPNPPADVVDGLARTFLGADLELRPLLRALLLHEGFWSTAARYALVRSPVEFVVATLQAVGLTAEQANPQWFMDGMGQVLYDPPNVAGWKQNGYWLATSSYWSRAAWLRYLRWQTAEAGLFADLVDTGADGGPVGAAVGVQAAFDRFGIVDPSPASRHALEAWWRGEADWRTGDPWSIVPNLVLLTGLTPDFHVA